MFKKIIKKIRNWFFPIKPICKYCRLFNPKDSCCAVVVLHEGEKVNIPVEPNDACFFQQEFTTKDGEKFTPSIQEIKMWVENEEGEKIDGNGIVKIEYPTEN